MTNVREATVLKSVETANITEQIQQYLPGAKLLLVRGYSSGNTDYKRAKTPISEGWGLKEGKNVKTNFKTYVQPTEAEVNNHVRGGGWIGAALDQNHCVVDIDTIKDKNNKVLMDGHMLGNKLLNLLKSESFKFHAIQTPNGFQFIFKYPKQSDIKNQVKEVTPLGVQLDYRTAGGMIVFPMSGTRDRFISHTFQGELDEVPGYLQPLYRPLLNKNKEPNFPIYPFCEGGRNDSLNKFLFSLRAFGGDKINETMIRKVGHLVNSYFTDPPMDTGEVDATIQSVLVAGLDARPMGQKFELFIEDKPSQVIVPKPFLIEDGMLKKVEQKKVEGMLNDVIITVCRHAPVITQSFANVEKSQMYHEVRWVDNGREYLETVPAGDIATKKNLLQLADKSLGVNDLNTKDLIGFFDKFIMHNDIPRGHLVERLGHVKGAFIHPLLSEGIKILPPDIGDKQIVDSFESVGTGDSWIGNVFDKVRDHPKAVIMLLGSFASVLLNDLNLSPFIIDLSGPTSKGKTTVLKVAASVWGNGHLVGEWNITKVAVERKAAFLNSFPLMLDDTMKADERELKNIVYNFSGGLSKGRGSITGTQTEFTWNNFLLSTGETSLTEYAMQAGGAAARVLPITGLPFEGVEYEFFNEIYEAIEDHHGAIGLDFLKQWRDKKESLIPLYKDFNSQFQKKSNWNEVLGRISRHYAALMFTAQLLNDFFRMEINLNELTNLFDEMARVNKAIDKPMQQLEAILSDLDADRLSILGDHFHPGKIKALYRDGTLILLPAYLKEFLITEQKAIRSEWLRRGISIPSIRNGNESDTKQYKHYGKNFSGVAIKPEILKELQFDFSTEK